MDKPEPLYPVDVSTHQTSVHHHAQTSSDGLVDGIPSVVAFLSLSPTHCCQLLPRRHWYTNRVFYHHAFCAPDSQARTELWHTEVDKEGFTVNTYRVYKNNDVDEYKVWLWTKA